MRCDNILKVTIPPCIRVLNFDPDLDGSTNYVVQVTDKFNQPYRKTIMSGYMGNMIIETGDVCFLKDGIFNEYAGTFLIEIFEADGTTPKPLAMCDEIYDAIELKVEGEATEDEEFIIACP